MFKPSTRENYPKGMLTYWRFLLNNGYTIAIEDTSEYNAYIRAIKSLEVKIIKGLNYDN